MYLEISRPKAADIYWPLFCALSLAQFGRCKAATHATRHPGIYAIYNKFRCYYVGYSFNLANRVKQHLQGQYSHVDQFRLWGLPAGDHIIIDAHRPYFITEEQRAIAELKPVENLEIDYSIPGHRKQFDSKYLLIRLTKTGLVATNEPGYYDDELPF